jgi:16S rRNA (adenine1518-N6/adenine1519-N6)-dimethyltransferase
MTDQPFAKKSLGQHWLRDQIVLADIVRSAELSPDDTVLEIGSGPGGLTAELVKAVRQVIAVELDERLAAALPERVQADNLRVLSQDILHLDFTSLPTGYKVVANIPYYLTGKLLRVLSETPNPPATAVLLLQKEVAERIAAGPGSLSILGVTTQFYWQVGMGRIVQATLFIPPPKVDSQVLVLHRRPQLLFSDVEVAEFFRIIKAGFVQPRKTLLNNLSAGLHFSRDEVQSICDRASIDSRRRAQTLSLDEWHSLYRAIHT